ncbi:MAG: hypothetical protein LBK56_06905 [Gracilibacteraceae bacterium]|jgi:hypothetical protein|nr:hypothetical protein [Gracilibacteraceae bacterium]
MTDLEGYIYDYRLGYVRAGMEGGFEIFGEGGAPGGRIVTLGGCGGWAARLYERMGGRTQIYDGCTDGYTSAQELIMLLRDGLLLKPKLVLCYSGFYNFAYKLGFVREKRYIPLLQKHPFAAPRQIAFYEKITARFGLGGDKVYYGEENDTPTPEYWLEQMDIIHDLCKEFGIRHLTFLQPCAFSGDYRRGAAENETLCEVYGLSRDGFRDEPGMTGATGETELDEFAALFREQYAAAAQAARSRDYIVDLSELFDGETGVYTNAADLSAAALDRLASAVFRHIGEERPHGAQFCDLAEYFGADRQQTGVGEYHPGHGVAGA